MSYLALFISLPTKASTGRMRVWRALKALGCATLRDGVYLLPESNNHAAALTRVAVDAQEVQGSAEIYRLSGCEEAQEVGLRALFDRSDDHAALLDEITGLAARLRSEPTETLIRAVRALRRRHDALAAIDYFPNQVSEHVHLALDDLEASLAERLSPDEPRAIDRAIPQLDSAEYVGRTWATRHDLWVDRVASAWLIRRFIDHKARFLWLEKPDACPKDALGFDYDGALFTHVGHRVTFETLLAAFGLEGDAGLVRLGGVIHALDAGGVTRPEAAGLAAMLRGIKTASRDDDDFLKRATPVFGALHTSFNEEATI